MRPNKLEEFSEMGGSKVIDVQCPWRRGRGKKIQSIQGVGLSLDR